ncbi:MAG TPA: DUF4363 family protein [Candidatus Evtepia faecavium]|nr:DUF4363 family protein [Candidatus Evtepia faecavium]
MRQLWAAVVILAGMLALLAWNGVVLQRQLQPLAEELRQAAAAAQQEDWDQAAALTLSLETQWQGQVPYLQVIHAHTRIDQVALAFLELKGALACRAAEDYTAAALRIAGTLEAMVCLERLSVGNLL